MKPRYFIGIGEPPVHVSDLKVGINPQVIFKGGGRAERKIDCESEESFLALLFELQQQRVPFSIGSHCPGPADSLVITLEKKGFTSSYVQISWYGPNRWEVREMDEKAKEWQEAPTLEEIANTSFKPDVQKRRAG